MENKGCPINPEKDILNDLSEFIIGEFLKDVVIRASHKNKKIRLLSESIIHRIIYLNEEFYRFGKSEDINIHNQLYRQIITKYGSAIRYLLEETILQNDLDLHIVLEQDIYDKIIEINKLYSRFHKPKRNGKGTREINAPKPALKLVQYALLVGLFHVENFTEEVQGSIPNRSILTNARKHLRPDCKAILNIDIKSAFPSTDCRIIRSVLTGFFRKHISDGENSFIFKNQRLSIADVIDRIIPIVSLDNELPQGSPSSPFLLNLALKPIDKAILKMIDEKYPGMIYTRYVDDMTFTWHQPFDAKTLSAEVSNILQSAYSGQYKINEEKTRYACPDENKQPLRMHEILILHPDTMRISISRSKFIEDFKPIFFAAIKELRNNIPNAEKDMGIINRAIGCLLFIRMVIGNNKDLIPKQVSKLIDELYELILKQFDEPPYIKFHKIKIPIAVLDDYSIVLSSGVSLIEIHERSNEIRYISSQPKIRFSNGIEIDTRTLKNYFTISDYESELPGFQSFINSGSYIKTIDQIQHNTVRTPISIGDHKLTLVQLKKLFEFVSPQKQPDKEVIVEDSKQDNDSTSQDTKIPSDLDDTFELEAWYPEDFPNIDKLDSFY